MRFESITAPGLGDVYASRPDWPERREPTPCTRCGRDEDLSCRGLCQDCQDRVAEGEGPRLCEWCGAGTWEDGSLGDCLCPACRAEAEEERS